MRLIERQLQLRSRRARLRCYPSRRETSQVSSCEEAASGRAVGVGGS